MTTEDDLRSVPVWVRRWFNPLGPKLAVIRRVETSPLDGSIQNIVLISAHTDQDDWHAVKHVYGLGKPNRRGWVPGYGRHRDSGGGPR